MINAIQNETQIVEYVGDQIHIFNFKLWNIRRRVRVMLYTKITILLYKSDIIN
jgi:hypothetical protein